MAVPSRVDDGKYSVPTINGTPNISYPFVSEGDAVSWEYRPRYWVDQASYKVPVMGTRVHVTIGGVNYGTGYIIDPGNPSDVGSGIYEYVPTIASLPVSRIVGRTMSATFTLRKGFAAASISKISNAQVLTEYSLSPFTPYIPPIITVDIFSIYIAYGTWSTFVFSKPFGAPIKVQQNPIRDYNNPWKQGDILVGQESKCDLYKAFFYYRETCFVTFPNFVTLQTS